MYIYVIGRCAFIITHQYVEKKEEFEDWKWRVGSSLYKKELDTSFDAKWNVKENESIQKPKVIQYI